MTLANCSEKTSAPKGVMRITYWVETPLGHTIKTEYSVRYKEEAEAIVAFLKGLRTLCPNAAPCPNFGALEKRNVLTGKWEEWVDEKGLPFDSNSEENSLSSLLRFLENLI